MRDRNTRVKDLKNSCNMEYDLLQLVETGGSTTTYSRLGHQGETVSSSGDREHCRGEKRKVQFFFRNHAYKYAARLNMRYSSNQPIFGRVRDC